MGRRRLLTQGRWHQQQPARRCLQVMPTDPCTVCLERVLPCRTAGAFMACAGNPALIPSGKSPTSHARYIARAMLNFSCTRPSFEPVMCREQKRITGRRAGCCSPLGAKGPMDGSSDVWASSMGKLGFTSLLSSAQWLPCPSIPGQCAQPVFHDGQVRAPAEAHLHPPIQ